MSLTIDQVLADAKRLVERLRDHDNAADSLIEQSSTLNKRIEAMKQVRQDHENNSEQFVEAFVHVHVAS